MPTYSFRDGPVIIRNAKKANAQQIGEAIEKARKEAAEGSDIRERLADDARNRRHPIHQHLEWNDAVAGHKYRLEQINDLIRVIQVQDDSTDDPRPAFISLRPNQDRRSFYTPNEIHSSADLQMAALRAADRDLEAFQRRHRVLSDICDDVDDVRRKLRERLSETESRAAAA